MENKMIKTKASSAFNGVMLKARKNVDQVIPYFILLILLLLIQYFQPGVLSGSWFARFKASSKAFFRIASLMRAFKP